MPAITKPNQHFDATLYTANGGTPQSITNAGAFQPDLVWVKSRSAIGDHGVADSVRGVNRAVFPSLTDAESNASSNYVTAFNSNGFSINQGGVFNGTNGTTMVAWQWKAGGTAVTNTSGTISSQVSANPTAGFSVVTYTGTGANATIGHGLGVTPSMIIFKVRSNGTYGWYCYHTALGAAQHIVLNTTAALSSSSFLFNDTVPTSTVMSVGTSPGTNQSGETYVAYCWAEVAGFSKIWYYIGNGSADGTFVYTGFRPRFIMIKNASTGGAGYDWFIYDTSRDTYNAATKELEANLTLAESEYALQMDILSNGFKWRASGAGGNGSGETYIYMAFAENPFKYANAR